jgi:hypothetical protein
MSGSHSVATVLPFWRFQFTPRQVKHRNPLPIDGFGVIKRDVVGASWMGRGITAGRDVGCIIRWKYCHFD